MTVISALVLFWMIWFITLLVMLPIGLQTQGEADQVVPGTPSSAPRDAMIRKKMIWTTIAAALDLGCHLRRDRLGRHHRPRPGFLPPDVTIARSGQPRGPLRTHNQKMTVAAMQMALMKVWAQRSYRVAMRRQSLSLPNIRSMRLRCL